MNGSTASLFVLGLSFMIFAPAYSYSILGMMKTLTYFMCYLMGYGLYEYKKTNDNGDYKPFYLICSYVIAGSFAHYLLNWFSNFSNFSSRNTVDFWTKTVIAATGQAPLACLSLAVSMACIFMKTNKSIKFISVFVLIATLGYNLILSGRTLFVLSLMIFCVAFLHKFMSRKTKKIKLLFTTVIIILAIFFVYINNVFGVKTAIENSQFYERFFTSDSAMEIDEDGRMENKTQYLQNATKYWRGGSNLHEQFGFAHDILLDTYDEASVFALIAIICYLMAAIGRLIRCLRTKSTTFEFRQVVLCVYTISFIQFMTEPILQGVQWLFASFCIIDGAVTRVLKDQTENTRETCV